MLNFFHKFGLYITLSIAVAIVAAFFILNLSPPILLFGSYALLFAAILLAILLPLISAIQRPKVLLVPLIGLASLALIFLIGYSYSDNFVLESGTDIVSYIEHDAAKFSGGLLNATFILVGISILSIFILPIINLFKD